MFNPNPFKWTDGTATCPLILKGCWVITRWIDFNEQEATDANPD